TQHLFEQVLQSPLRVIIRVRHTSIKEGLDEQFLKHLMAWNLARTGIDLWAAIAL
ncbi:MAG: hypothetical protein HC880_00655, partial [Bacteroidia bacterium]|nr:hypothetical protein [Bacteroidia bacterium]